MFNTDIKKILDMINEDTFVISDTHFRHNNILTFEPGRLTAMQIDGHDDHDEWLIETWNSVVGEDDVVLHLGDFAFKGIQEVQHRLNGIKILILGNHDRKGSQTYSSFDFVINGLYVEAGGKGIPHHYLHADTEDRLTSMLIKEVMGKKILFCHYPVDETELRFRKPDQPNPLCDRLLLAKDLYYAHECDVNVHGHTHSNCMQDRDSRVFKNVSIENIGFKPTRLKDVLC